MNPKQNKTQTLLVAGLMLTLAATAGCKKSDSVATNEQPAATETTKNAQVGEQPNKPEPKGETPKKGPRIVKPPAPPPIFSGSHILVAYKGAMRANPQITRTKDEAKKKASELATEARKNPKSFPEMAKKNSDGPSAGNGGSLGAWPKGQMVPQFDQAIETMKIGDISEPVETPFGFHVIRRDAPPPLFSGSHILVAYKGAMRAAGTVSRSKEEAKKLAQELMEKINKDPKLFEELAKKHSDGPSGPTGGKLGTWPKGRMVPVFDQAIEKLKIGEISPPVESPFGVHVIRRDDPEAK